MKRTFSLFLPLLTLLLCLAACERYVAPDPTVRRTVLIYMEARNNLAADAYDDIAEMKRASIPADCRLLIYLSTQGVAPKLFEIVNGREVPLKIYPEETSAVDPAQLRSVIASTQELAPAREYGLILWSHSSGWQQSPVKVRGFGLEYSYKQISTSDLADAVEGFNLDFIIFDTCYMGCIEVAYELRNAARFMVASVCEVPNEGMPYDATLPALMKPNIKDALIETININHSINAPANVGGCPVTLSLIDLSRMDALAQAVKDAPLPLPDDFIPQVFSVSHPYRHLFFDFGQYYNAIGGDPDPIKAAIIHERHSLSIWGQLRLDHCSGLSIYLPQFAPGYDYNSHGYSSLEYYKFIHSTN